MARQKRVLEDLGDYELDPETAAKIDRMIAQADAEPEEIRVNFRWGRMQLGLVKHVANLMGVPYQTYIKQVLYRQVQQDLSNFRANGTTNAPSRSSKKS